MLPPTFRQQDERKNRVLIMCNYYFTFFNLFIHFFVVSRSFWRTDSCYQQLNCRYCMCSKCAFVFTLKMKCPRGRRMSIHWKRNFSFGPVMIYRSSVGPPFANSGKTLFKPALFDLLLCVFKDPSVLRRAPLKDLLIHYVSSLGKHSGIHEAWLFNQLSYETSHSLCFSVELPTW